MATVQCGGVDVLHGEIHLPLKGSWWADLKLDTATPPTAGSSTTIAAINGINITGTIGKAGVFIGTSVVRVYGGAGGLGNTVPAAAYQNALLRDPLGYVLKSCGETASNTIAPSVSNLLLTTWTITAKKGARCLDELCWAVGQGVNWRNLADGTVWLGTETWPSQSLPTDSEVVWQYAVGPRYEIACGTPFLMPGVSLPDIGGLNVGGVSHWIDDSIIRTWAYAS